MNDRELLEKAAKAANISLQWDEEGTAWKKWPSFAWNPLTDDGDAFRLFVKIDLCVEPEGTFKMAAHRFAGWHPKYSAKEKAGTNHDADRCAAMRRAITRVAASIGEQQ